MAKAFATANAGTTILLREGIYYEGDLVFTGNGQPGKPIVVRSFPGESAVLDGANPAGPCL